jgi:hypothetical protein
VVTLVSMQILHIVTGAPGAGRTTSLQALLTRRSDYIAFDIDWLALPASELAGRSINFDSSTWPAYGRIWFEILHGVQRNGRIAVLFAPLGPEDLAAIGRPDWYDGVNWILLDCAGDVRATPAGTVPKRSRSRSHNDCRLSHERPEDRDRTVRHGAGRPRRRFTEASSTARSSAGTSAATGPPRQPA